MLDGLRAVAVFLVIFYHAGLPSPGGLGVLMFFVISGFLITWLLLKENAKRRDVSLRGFYTRRAMRIFPAFYGYAALLLGLLLVTHRPVIWSQAAAALLYYNDYYQAILGDPNTGFSHTWSLSVEEQFYLAWPLLFLWGRNRPAQLARVLTGGIVAVWVYRAVLKYGFHVWQGYFYEAFDTRADQLLLGCLFAVLLWTGKWARVWVAVCGVPQFLAVTGALVVSVLVESRMGAEYRDVFGFPIDTVLVALMLVQLISLRDHAAVAWMQAAPVRYLGRISYSLYLYQQLVLPVVESALRRYDPAVRVSVAVALVVGTASASFYLIEKPFLLLKDRMAAALLRRAAEY